MINRYNKGRRKEYALIHAAKALGHIAFRSAGSHSPIDVVEIDTDKKTIWLLQSKIGLSMAATGRLYEQHKELSGNYTVIFKIV